MTSRLADMQARFQQKQMEQKEEKLLKLYENQQQRAFERVGRGSAGSNASNTSIGSTGGGKVRQMFDERRQKAGVDRSYPLQPLKNSKPTVDRKTSKTISTRTSVKSTSQNNTYVMKTNKVNERKHIISTNIISDYKDKSDELDSESHRDLIAMMNNHNLKNNIDDEEIPPLALNDINGSHNDDYNFKMKENSPASRKNIHRKTDSTMRHAQEANPIVRRSIIKTESSPSGKGISDKKILSPTKATSQTMSAKAAKRPPTQNSKSPSSGRPSAKQAPRSPVVRDDLVECKFCGRRFASDRLEVHEAICSKTGNKKRKTYDATKHRLQGTELEPYVKKGGKGGSIKSTKPAQKKDWRKTHEEFIAAIKAAKMAQAHISKGGKLSDLPPPPPSSNPDYVQCPHCGRRFNEAAAERHIPKCANYQFNKPKSTQSKGKHPSAKK